MRRFSGLIAALAACLTFSACSPEPSAQGNDGDFDFYVLALSWSPGYCESEGRGADPGQCSPGRAYEFVLHGLWPQYERGYPQNCGTDAVNRDIVHSMLDIMPAPGLVRHEWRKHGTCTDLSPQTYFERARAAYERVVTPPSFEGLRQYRTIATESVERLFQASNPDLPSDAIAVTCKRQYLRDVRICLTKDLASFHPCPEVDANFCRRNSVAVPPVR